MANTNEGGHLFPAAEEKHRRAEDLDDEEKAISLTEENWQDLIQNLREGKCTPFLGAGASMPPLPSAASLAQKWSSEFGYPLPDCRDLSRVSQFLSVTRSPSFPKIKIRNYFSSCGNPDFTTESQIHGVLAELPLPVYVTTNYDDYMTQALLGANPRKYPRREMCRWNTEVRHQPSIFETEPNFQPTAGSPLVFHLHGFKDFPPSLVLTEDDYVDFLISMDQGLLPPPVQHAFTGSSLMFLGYGLSDWNFRVLYRTMVTYLEKSLRSAHVSVQLAPLDKNVPEATRKAVLNYLNRYFDRLDIRVYWGTCHQFTRELRDRWRVETGGIVTPAAGA